jgi:hypothetical protein
MNANFRLAAIRTPVSISLIRESGLNCIPEQRQVSGRCAEPEWRIAGRAATT